MNDTGSAFTTHSTQVLDMMKECVDERSLAVTGGWMHDHARRLIDDREVGIVIDDRDRKGFRLGYGRFQGRDFQRNEVAVTANGAGVTNLAADVSHAPFDQALDL